MEGKRRIEAQGRPLSKRHLEPWPDLVNPQELAQAVVDEVRRYVILPEGSDVAVALWVMHSYVFNAFMISPILAITSPEKRCGKTTLISVLSRCVRQPVVASNVSMAVLYRLIEQSAPCIFIDEADTFLRGNRELIGVLNSGQNRAGAHVLRVSGDDQEPREFSTWAPKVIAAIRDLPPTIEDRAIVIRMRRRLPGEIVARLRLDRTSKLDDLTRKLARWAIDAELQLVEADPHVPEILNDRAADNWRPLLAIADTLGGSWPNDARRAAIALGYAEEPEESAQVRLLRDVRRVFRANQRTRLSTEELIEALHGIDESPWKEWADGTGLTPHIVARYLGYYGVRSTAVAVGNSTKRGYRLEDFSDAFQRYLSTGPQQAKEPQGPERDDACNKEERGAA